MVGGGAGPILYIDEGLVYRGVQYKWITLYLLDTVNVSSLLLLLLATTSPYIMFRIDGDFIPQ